MITQTIISIAMAAFCYMLMSLQWQGKLVWSDSRNDFWGRDSWIRKYHHRMIFNQNTGRVEPIFFPPKDNWYYRFFKIAHEEAFPGSSQWLVMWTDGFHMMQFWFEKFIFIAVAVNTDSPWLWFFGLWAGFTTLFSIGYKFMSA